MLALFSGVYGILYQILSLPISYLYLIYPNPELVIYRLVLGKIAMNIGQKSFFENLIFLYFDHFKMIKYRCNSAFPFAEIFPKFLIDAYI